MDSNGPPGEGGPSASGVERPGPPPGSVRVRMVLAYDGSDFHGFAENEGVATVAGAVRAAVELIVGHGVVIACAGRTDAGVHARGQVISFDLAAGTDLERLRRRVNALTAPRVVAIEAETAADTFDARFSATHRTYRYFVLNRPVPDPFVARSAWWVADRLDRDALAEACVPLLGDHDFTSFCRRPKDRDDASLVRRVHRAGWTDEPSEGPQPALLRFEIQASAFCHQMVRSIVGLLVDVGRGHRTPADVTIALTAADRSRAGQLAPPHGLFLWEVGYGASPPTGALAGGIGGPVR